MDDFGYDGGDFGGGDFGGGGGDFGGGNDSGGFGGGGFGSNMGGAQAYGGDESGGFMESGSQSSQTPKNYNNKIVNTVTIAQINNAEKAAGDDDFTIDGRSTKHVAFIGEIVEVDVKTTHVLFTLEDGTGKIQARLFSSDNSDDAEGGAHEDPANGLRQGMWVRCHAAIKNFNDQKQISVFGFVPIKQIDAITHHYLQAMFEHCRTLKGPLKRTDGSESVASKNEKIMTPGMQIRGGQGPSIGAGASSLNDKIMDFVKKNSNGDVGIHQNSILSQNFGSRAEVMKIIADLCDEGMLYSTIDDDHFMSTS